ncbi:NlpC/P60 family protein [Pseudomonas arsenicoxydans]|uniref:Peptidoglycan endopeptidase n=1 Tax=Pseudomonas arsenicoxydans TaxID=702115 RepID=A0A502GSB5_9PSED|nr:peptidoglycan endopeptidase [Pseudomonas arsenicoxydans]
MSYIVAKIVDRAHALIDTPYRWSGNSLKTGFECSGFMVCLLKARREYSFPEQQQRCTPIKNWLFLETNYREEVFFNITDAALRGT